MPTAFDMVIRGGTVVDGSGGEPFKADVAIEKGRIAQVGNVSGRGREELDAQGLIVTPGFIDIHTHYDGQVTWEQQVTPSSQHGVTTVVMGNCGIGFAPCRPGDRAALVRLMEGVEDLPEPVLTAGLPWNWQTFPEYLDRLAERSYDIDIAAQVPHAAVRVHVMGQRAVDHEAATSADIAQMAELTREALTAGALGFSTSRSINHRASDGNATPTLKATEAELTGIALGVRASGAGVLQVISDFTDPQSDFAMLERVAERSQRPMSISVLQFHQHPDRWREVLAWITAANTRGLHITAQVSGRPVGGLLGLDMTVHPFVFCPSYKAVAHLPLAERVALLRQPQLRDRILAETPDDAQLPIAPMLQLFDLMYPLGDPPDYEPDASCSITARASRLGVSPARLAYDLLLERNGQAALLMPVANFADNTLDATLEMMRHPHSVLGLGDGGAHLGFLCDASLPTYMLTHWVRDRVRGARLPLPWVVKALSSDNARVVGLEDRGLVSPGYKADLNLIDIDRLALLAPEVHHDLPAQGRRLSQRASGYSATIVNGIVTAREGIPTGELPGRLVRGTREPSSHALCE